MCIRALARSQEAEHKAQTCLCACMDRIDAGVTIDLLCVDAIGDILLREMKKPVSESEESSKPCKGHLLSQYKEMKEEGSQWRAQRMNTLPYRSMWHCIVP